MPSLDLYNGPPNIEHAIELCFSCLENGPCCKIHSGARLSPQIFCNNETFQIFNPEQISEKDSVDNREIIKFGKNEESSCPGSVLVHLAAHEKKIESEKENTYSLEFETVLSTDLPRKKFSRFREKKFICDVCDASFTMKQNIAAHLFLFHVQPDGSMKKTEKKWFRCKECSQIFRSSTAAEIHFKKKHQKRGNVKVRSDCEECGKSFTSAFQLREHIAIQHLKERNFKCDQCEQRFGRRGGLRRHVQMVHQNHLHKCPYEECDHPGYKCSKALTAHIRSVHTNVRPFVCTECEKAFVRKNDLKMHELTHRKDIEFTCTCGHSFRRQMYLKKHQKTCNSCSNATMDTV